MRKTSRNNLIIMFMVLILTGESFALDLKDVQKRYSEHKDFEATFSQHTFQALVNKEVDFTGKVSCKRPDCVRMDVYTPQRQIIILKGTHVTVSLPAEGTLAVQEIPKEIATQNILAFINGLTSLDKDYNVKQEKDHLVLTPKNGTGTINIWIDEDNLVKRIQVQDAIGNKSDIRLKQYTFNLGLKDDLFKLPLADTNAKPMP
jgi:chaperone LolA